MEEVTKHIIAQMKRVLKEGTEFTAWDINRGCCEDWAMEAQRRFGGEVLWYDQILGQDPLDCDHSHAVLYLNDRYYDSQNPEGCMTIQEMYVFRKVSRDEYLQS